MKERGRDVKERGSWRAEVPASLGPAPRRSSLAYSLGQDHCSPANDRASRTTGRPLHDDLIASLMLRRPFHLKYTLSESLEWIVFNSRALIGVKQRRIHILVD